MNAEALIGKALGTCTLQRLIGQGGMGTVFLAQQSRPHRQVAVKVLLPITRLSPSQHAAFLERFRRETDAAASLEHPNILPVHEYGEVDGLAYLVMPYISGGTLRDELERTRQLPLPKAVQYLDQIAAALEVAHARGVVHRDVKPANILMTAEGRLLLTDFGLVKVIEGDASAQASLTGAGVPLGTPDYMAPEQVIGGEINARTDLYALGVVLFQMVTGRTPFKGAMPMQIAMQQISTPPPSPRSLREDLPMPAEQVILRAMAKKPADRYASAQDIASAFRLALAVAGIQLTPQNPDSTQNVDNRARKTKGLFDPSWQTGMVPSSQPLKPKLGGIGRASSPSLVPMTPRPAPETAQNDIVAKTSMTLPSFADFMPPSTSSAQPANNTYTMNNPYTPISFAPDMPQEQRQMNTNAPLPTTQPGTNVSNAQSQIQPRFRQKLGLRPTTNDVADENVPQAAFPISPVFPSIPSTPRDTTGNIAKDVALNRASPAPSNSLFGTASTQQRGNTGALGQSGSTGTLGQSGIYPGQGTTTTMKLQQSFKVVQVPVAGQPGQFVTGFLPVLPQEPEEAETTPKTSADALKTLLAGKPVQAFRDLQKSMKIAVLLVAAFLVIFSSGIFLIAHNHSTNTTQQKVVVMPNAVATISAQATATMQANIILSDPLSENGHNWHVATSGPQIYTFKDHAYHILNNDTKSLAIALLPDESVSGSYAYSLTMDALSGDETSITNQFGMVFNFGVHQKNGKTYKSFYIFEVANTKGGNYQLLKYDDSGDPANSPWTTIWSGRYGNEFHQGHGPQNTNTFKVVISGKKFTLLVNGKKVGDAQDGSLTGGLVGMLVNLNKTEVAFSNLLLTYK
jgi:serine/threonine protein kinase